MVNGTPFLHYRFTFFMLRIFDYESVEYGVVVVKFKIVSITFGCFVICVKSEFFVKVLGFWVDCSEV
jgi:hypothetical protein